MFNLKKVAQLEQQLDDALKTIEAHQKTKLEEITELKAKLANANAQIAGLEKYAPIADIDKEIQNRLSDCSEKENAINQRIVELEEKYKGGHSTYLLLRDRISIFRETLNLSEYGVYEPHFNFDTPESYKEAIIEVRERQKEMVRAKLAAGGSGYLWNYSKVRGRVMGNRDKKLMLRTFNGECESFIAIVRWNNIDILESRIEKSFNTINELYRDHALFIAEDYKNLKIDELRLAYEYQLKRHEEKEEQRALRELMREEEKAQRDIEAAKIKAEKEEALYLKVLEKVHKEMEAVSPEKQQELLRQVEELEEKLRSVERDRQRALSMAQQTRRGYVYIISNIGSFGENIYKIGMTRRLDPMDRIRELGDASVPFQFDVHAIIFAEDAPSLENALHKAFEHKRLNRVNMRREFFSCNLDEIEIAIEKHHDRKIECVRVPEAQQYRESLAIIGQGKQNEYSVDQETFNEKLFTQQIDYQK